VGLSLTLIDFISSHQNWAMKTKPRSEAMGSGRPWYLKMRSKKRRARSGAVRVSTVGQNGLLV